MTDELKEVWERKAENDGYKLSIESATASGARVDIQFNGSELACERLWVRFRNALEEFDDSFDTPQDIVDERFGGDR